MFDPINFLEKFLDRFLHSKTPTPGHSSQWGGILKLNRSSGGFRFGKVRTTLEESFRGGLVIGGSGSGKTISTIIPTILNIKGSVIVHDPSFELLRKTGLQMQSKGYEVQVFNPTAVNLSSPFNPLSSISSSQDANIAAERIIGLLYPKPSGDLFWVTSSKALISLAIQILLCIGEKNMNLPNLFHLLNQFESSGKLIMTVVKNSDDPMLWGNFMAFMKSDEKMRAGILATARSALSYLNDQRIGRLLSENRLTAKKFRQKKTVLYVQTGTAHQKYFYLLTSLLFESLFSELLKAPPKSDELPIHFVIDEAASLSCPMLSTAMANLRKYKVGILLAVQDFSQLTERYGADDARTIRSNCFSQLVLPGAGLELGTYYQELLGKTQLNGKTVPLLSADSLRRLKSGTALLIQGNKEPVIVEVSGVKMKEVELKKISRDPSLVPRPVSLFNFNHNDYD